MEEAQNSWDQKKSVPMFSTHPSQGILSIHNKWNNQEDHYSGGNDLIL
jgi:hypothetical protein